MGGLLDYFRRIFIGIVVAGGMASPAAARDCFVRVRAADARAAGPAHRVAAHRRAAPARTVHRPRPVRHTVGPAPVRRPAVAIEAPAEAPSYAESSSQMRTLPVYEMRPARCDSQPPTALQSRPPAEFRPPAQQLLDELAGPGSRVAAGPAPPPPGEVLVGPAFVASPGDTGGAIPGLPTVGPLSGGPLVGLPPGGSTVEGPPVVASLPVAAAIPEPATWAMMILGFLAVGAALRSRRSAVSRGTHPGSGD